MELIPVDQRKADMQDPAQHFGWALSSIPPVDFNPELPSMVLPIMYIPWFSTFLYKCGFRHHPELQVLEQQVDDSAPLRNAGVSWVEKQPGEPLQPVVPDVDLAALSDQEAAGLLLALKERLGL